MFPVKAVCLVGHFSRTKCSMMIIVFFLVHNVLLLTVLGFFCDFIVIFNFSLYLFTLRVVYCVCDEACDVYNK